jgi:hypothetical protein
MLVRHLTLYVVTSSDTLCCHVIWHYMLVRHLTLYAVTSSDTICWYDIWHYMLVRHLTPYVDMSRDTIWWYVIWHYSTGWTQHNTLTKPKRTPGSLSESGLGSLSEIWVRSGLALGLLWGRSGFAIANPALALWVRYLGALYALMREADTALILPTLSPVPCIF